MSSDTFPARYRPNIGLRSPGRLLLGAVITGLLTMAVVPSSITPLVHLGDFYCSLWDFAIVAIGAVAYCLKLYRALFIKTDVWLYCSTLLLVIGMVGVINNGLHDYDWLTLSWPLLVFVFTPMSAKVIAVGLRRQPDAALALSYTISAIALIYIVASVWATRMGLRGGVETALGEARVGGPIGNAATIQMVFIPPLAYLLFSKKNTYSVVSSIVLFLACMLTFSRAAFVALICLAGVYVLKYGSCQAKMFLVLLASACVFVFFLFIADEMLAARLLDMDVSGRSESAAVALSAFRERPIFGAGYSELWPWWGRQGDLIAGLRENRWDGLTTNTRYGLSLWNPHSVLSYFGGEMGVTGLVLALLILLIPIRRVWRNAEMRLAVVGITMSGMVDALSTGAHYAFAANVFPWWLLLFCLGQMEPVQSAESGTIGHPTGGFLSKYRAIPTE